MADADRDADGVYTGPGTKDIPLRTAVKRNDGTDLTSITLNEPTADQLSQYFAERNRTNDDGVKATILLISLVSGVLPVDTAKLRQRDLDACGEWLSGFTPVPPLKTSGNSATA